MSTLPDSPLLRVNDLTKIYRSGPAWKRKVITAVRDVSFTLREGETFGLVGESGSGKSTTARMAIGLIPPSRGSVHFNGTDITRISVGRLRRMRCDFQMVFQDPYGSLNARMTVEQQLSEPLQVHNYCPRREWGTRMRQLLEQVGLPGGALTKYPHEFSGGQRQRICIARALAVNPSLVVADEPVSALDVSVQAQVLNLMRDLQDELGLAYLFISHDLNVVKFMGGRIGVLKNGEMVETGESEAVYRHPQHPYTEALLAASPDVESGVRLRAHQSGGDMNSTRGRVSTSAWVGHGRDLPC